MFYGKALYFHSSFTLLGFSIGSGKLLGKPDELPWIACNRGASHPGWGRGGELGLGLTWEQKYIFCKFQKMWPLNLSNLIHNLLLFRSFLVERELTKCIRFLAGSRQLSFGKLWIPWKLPMWLLTFSGAEEGRSKYICFECNHCNPNFPSKSNFQCRDESNAGFTQLCSVIGPETCAILSTNQIQSFKESCLGHSRFSASGSLDSLLVFILSSHWLMITWTFVLIGRWNYLGFGFSTLNSCSKIN